MATPPRNNSDISETREKSSVSNIRDAIQKHIDIDWTVDFSKSQISGSVTISFQVLKDTSALHLDTRGQTILSIDNVSDEGNAITFTHTKAGLIEESSPSGNLTLTPSSAITARDELYKIRINYHTSPDASGLQWLAKEATKDKLQPYLFSQFQAIHARSVVPCQDVPEAKITYAAKVRVENEHQICLMSALSTSNADNVYNFEQKVPVPSYLIAIVVGALESRELGPRSRVWSEPSMADASQYEFAETEKFIQTAESIVGPYVWGRYDLLVLPPTFPYGGMENPCLTFATPTLIAGDRSLANVVAHEIAHSWTGNLVGCTSWEHFWLNEGHTVFLERKIGERMYGEKVANLDGIEGQKALQGSIDAFGKDNILTAMVTKNDGIDPDDAFSSVPYEKGCNLLVLLEQKLGGKAIMEPWFLAYVQKFAYKTATTKEWKDFLYEYFSDKTAILDTVDWEMWFHQAGMPTQLPVYDDTLAVVCQKLAAAWKPENRGAHNHSVGEYNALSPKQKIELFALLGEDESLDESTFQLITSTYDMAKVNNSEIRFKWIMFGLKNKDETAFAAGQDMATVQGRMKFTRPLYRSMNTWKPEETKALFAKNRPFMHPTTAAMVAKDIGVQ